MKSPKTIMSVLTMTHDSPSGFISVSPILPRRPSAKNLHSRNFHLSSSALLNTHLWPSIEHHDRKRELKLEPASVCIMIEGLACIVALTSVREKTDVGQHLQAF